MTSSLLTRIAVGVAALTLAAAPLAASADDWHGGDHDRGNAGYHDRGNWGYHDRDRDRDDWRRHDWGYARPVYQQRYVNGYFGLAPGGFRGYFYNGGWYQHRRWNGGIWIYF
jgi:hypothetical protein